MRIHKTARATFARPANTTAYAVGDIVANATAANAVTPLVLAVAGAAGQAGKVTRVSVAKSSTVTADAAFRLHLYAKAPTPANGDNGALSANGVASNYLGSADVTVDKAQGDGAIGFADVAIPFQCESGVLTLFGLLEARGAYVPASGETLKVAVSVERSQL
ncbi:MAG: hypothetical protein ACOY5R_10725 [Pseudomonadota bacterium]